jgi:predicted O-methyltransferase YrrM
MMNNINKIIWDKFRIKRGGAPPFLGWKSTRVTLAQLFLDLGFINGAEIGVQTGVYSEVLLKNNPNLQLMCVDPWRAYHGVTQEQSDKVYDWAISRLEPYKDRVTILRETSVEAARNVPDASLDFVYIDGAHDFNNVMLDILHWYPKVKRYGIFSGHDYYIFFRGGVVRAVDTFTQAHNINQWYMTHETLRSWFWVVDW